MTPYSSYIPNMFMDTITGARGSYNILVYLPIDYKTKSYPCVYFFNGKGEDVGSNNFPSVLAKWGPLSQISSTNQPNFIVMCVQAVGWDVQQNIIYTTLRVRYNISNVILTGISEGGWVATDIMGGLYMPSVGAPGPNNPVQADTVCFIPMSAQIDSTVYTPAAVATIAKLGIPVLGFGDDPGDIWGINTHNLIKALVAINPTGNYQFINTPGTGHGGWNTQYGSGYKLAGTNGNLYDWALQFAGVAPPVIVPPPVTPPAPRKVISVSVKTISVVVTYDDGKTDTFTV